MQRLEWPDGRPYLEQPSILIEVFDIVKDEAIDRLNQIEKQRQTKKGRR